MTDSLMDKYIARHTTADDGRSDSELEELEYPGCFGWLRGIRDRAIMLEMRKKNGHILAVGYSWLERVEFEPDSGITLHLLGREVRIKGSRLNVEARPTVRLLDGIVRHRVPWIRESDQSEQLGASDNNVLIESIRWDD